MLADTKFNILRNLDSTTGEHQASRSRLIRKNLSKGDNDDSGDDSDGNILNVDGNRDIYVQSKELFGNFLHACFSRILHVVFFSSDFIDRGGLHDGRPESYDEANKVILFELTSRIQVKQPKVYVTIGEIYRRINFPEVMNTSILSCLLRK